MADNITDSLYLCLNCRNSGHISRACPGPWPSKFPHQKWAFSPRRIEFFEEHQYDLARQHVCNRCRKLNITALFDGELPWKAPEVMSLSKLARTQYYRNLGRASSVIFRKDCSLCICLFAIVPGLTSAADEIHIVADWMIHRLERLVELTSHAHRHREKCILAFTSPRDEGLDFTEHYGDALGLVKDSQATYSLNPQLVNHQHADIGLIKRWISTCQRLHPITCFPNQDAVLRDILLIDVETRSVAKYPGGECEYLALSYVWGRFSQAHYLRDQPLPDMPQTIEDALLFCKMLGKRYLWVDSVCIDQGDEVAKIGQIQIMSSIYRGAYASIIAVSGPSMGSGLPRLISSFSHSSQPQISCLVDGKRLVGLMPTLSQQTHMTKWGERAWTLQEALLSPRCIYLSTHQVYFECNAMQCCESIDERRSWIHQSFRGPAELDGGLDPEMFGGGTLRNSNASNGKPRDSIFIYGTLVTLYSYRHMTNDSDGLNAFSGIMQHLQRLTYGSGFFWGLPEEDFNWSLLWYGQSSLQRREGFPGWSWAGWKGPLWTGRSMDDYETQKSWTHFYAWKLEDGNLVTIYPPQSLDVREMETVLFQTPSIFDSYTTQKPDDGMTPPRKPEQAEAKGCLIIECDVCAFDFEVLDDEHTFNSSSFDYHDIRLNKMTCSVRSIEEKPQMPSKKKISIKNLALIARDRIEGEVYHYFLHLETRGDGCATRNGIFWLVIPENKPETLRKVKAVRRKILLT